MAPSLDQALIQQIEAIIDFLRTDFLGCRAHAGEDEQVTQANLPSPTMRVLSTSGIPGTTVPAQDDRLPWLRLNRFERLNDRHDLPGLSATTDFPLCSSGHLSRFDLMNDRPKRVFRKTPRPSKMAQDTADIEGKCEQAAINRHQSKSEIGAAALSEDIVCGSALLNGLNGPPEQHD